MEKIMIELTLENLIEHLGEPVRQRGAEYEWQCPFCQDWHEDNLKFNENKEIRNFKTCIIGITFIVYYFFL